MLSRPNGDGSPNIGQQQTPLQSELGGLSSQAPEPIAIIGIGCHFPGARGPEAFWRLMVEGQEAISEIPPDRFDINAYYDPTPGIPGKIATRRAGFISDIDQFDPAFFGISRREAVSMDPQQRILLEISWEALEDAGQVPSKLANSPTGVFIGMCSSDYGELQMHYGDSADLDVYSVPGSARSIMSGRLSYIFNLQGPSVVVDTACSSSLAAVHLACQSLWSGECMLALAGGVNLILMPETFAGFSVARMLAPDGRCKAFDARANGFVRSEGAGVVVLKPLSLAQADGNPIYAVIRGSAANNDGHSSGMMMPSQQAQEEVVRAACRQAEISPKQIHYIETHGTGTSVGDPIEARALGAVLGEGRSADRPCIIGSVKTNIGHLEGGAGIAGLIKVALCLKHRAIPPSLHFETPNPYIPWDELPLKVADTLSPWPVDDEVAIAGVNSFGISGTNVHVVLQEPDLSADMAVSDASDAAYLFPLSTHRENALESAVRAYHAFLGDGTETSLMRDLCYTASLRRTHQPHRLAVVAHSPEELSAKLDAYQQGMLPADVSSGVAAIEQQHKLVFVFSGQGPKFWPLDIELLAQEPVFRSVLEQCETILQSYGVDWSLLESLTTDSEDSRLLKTDVCQAAIFATQVALAALWRSWGIEPAAVVGHSLGEVAAAHVAGAITLEEAIRVVYHRGRVTKKASGKGRMALVRMSLEEAQAFLTGYEDQLAVAVNNSPTSCTLSGEPTALAEVLKLLQAQDVFCRELPAVDYAAHSPQMEPLKDELAQALQDLLPTPTSVPLFSTVTGRVEAGDHFGVHYWGDNLRQPVRFSDTLQELLRQGHDIFLEVHPHPVLSRPIEEGLSYAQREGMVLPSLQRGAEGRAMLLGSLGKLYTCGYAINWHALYGYGARHVSLPSSAFFWQRERYWLPINYNGNQQKHGAALGEESRHPLLGWHISTPASVGMHLTTTKISVKQLPYLGDHRVQGLVILPAAAYVEMALAAANESFGPGNHSLEEMVFQKAIFLPEQGAQEIQIVLSAATSATTSLQFYSRPESKSDPEAKWTLHAHGTLRLGRSDETAQAVQHTPSPAEFQAYATETVTGAEHYQTMTEHGLEYGPAFQGVGQIWRLDGEAVARLELPETVTATMPLYQIHPALLDVCFQVLAAAIPQAVGQTDGKETFLPVGLKQIRVLQQSGDNLFVHAILQLSDTPSTEQLVGDIFLLDDKGDVLVEIRGLSLQKLGLATENLATEKLDDWLYEIQWQAQKDPEIQTSPDTSGAWLIFTHRDRVTRLLAKRLRALGGHCILVTPGNCYRKVYKRDNRWNFEVAPKQPDDIRRVLEDVGREEALPLRGILYLWGLQDEAEVTEGDISPAAQDVSYLGFLHVVQALAQAGWREYPRLWVITRGAQHAASADESVAVEPAPLWGLVSVAANEHPELHCSAIDLDAGRSVGEVKRILQEIWTDGRENRVAFRGKERRAARLVRYMPERVEKLRPAMPGEAYQLEVTTPGILDHMVLRAVERQAPAPGQVEIQVRAAGLNFLDVLTALGMRPDQEGNALMLGMECAGIVSAVGEGVSGIQVGDEVMASAPNSFSAYTRTVAPFVVPKPAHMSFEEAATIPVAFLTAHYALNYFGRLRKGERILIHAAAGGVGLAAVRLAQRVGAEIFATASRGKWDFLRSLGVQHIMDSRSLAFADEVMKLTNGEGVDVVLNSLAGEAIPKSLATLRANGRFLEIGKRDIYENSKLDMGLFRKNIAFFAIDLIPMFTEQPEFCGELLHELMQFFEDGALDPISHTVFPISQVDDAFRYMAQAKHIGKIVLSMEDENVIIAPASRSSFRANGTYLITGGLGGLGLSIAQWMVKRGARHLVLIGRRAPSTSAAEMIAQMEAEGARIVTRQADVTQEEQMARVLEQIDRTMPPLRGVIHAAGLLDDGILLQLNEERFRRVMAPKVEGGWILHRLTKERELDHFVLFSSVASIFGSPGQGNYVAANAFLDTLAHYRRLQGLPALSINWGAWAEVGLAVRADRASHVLKQGILPFTPQQGVQLLELILQHDPTQVTALAVDWPKLLKTFSPPLLSEIMTEVSSTNNSSAASGKRSEALREKLRAIAPEEQRAAVEIFLRDQIAQVLRAPADKLDIHQPLDQLGIDSLMAYELKTRVETELNLTLPVAALLQGPSVVKLTTVLLEQLKSVDVLPVSSPTLSDTADDILVTQIDQLSEQEVESMLYQLLEEPQLLEKEVSAD